MSQAQAAFSRLPTEQDATRVVETVLGGHIATIARFPTGLAHVVYDVCLADGRRCVARLTRPEQARQFAGGVHWHGLLSPLGVPLPALLYADVTGAAHGFPVMLLERLPGTDLGAVYPALTRPQKATLAAEVVEAQRRTALLPPACGYGYATVYDDPLAPTWDGAIAHSLARCRDRLRAAGVVDEDVVVRLERALGRNADYFATVRPVPTLDDATTKNVIVHDGRLSGIVDVDFLFFGDPMVAPALTRMSLLGQGYDTDYIDAWLDAMEASAAQRRVLDVYTAWFCVGFLSELGHAFNQEAAPPVDPAKRAMLLDLLDGLLAKS